jgi:hypothetical protein
VTRRFHPAITYASRTALILTVLICVVGAIPVRAPIHDYRAVSAEGGTRDPGDMISSGTAGIQEFEDYALLDGALYLRFQTTRGALLLVTHLDFREWTAADVEAFRKAHPKLEPHWPDPTRADGGVAWIDE